MRQRQLILSIIVLTFLALLLWWPNQASHGPTRIACVGDSITLGSGSSDKEHLNYPAQLANMLGEKWDVKNFGANDTSALFKGEKPYIKKRAFKLACRFRPNIIIINLGTNDSKEQNWRYKQDFVKDYIALINRFQHLPSHPTVFLCYPPPAFTTEPGINGQIIKEEILPLINKIAQQTNLITIDLYDALKNRKELFPDTVHPNDQGYHIIAQTVFDVIKGNLKETK